MLNKTTIAIATVFIASACGSGNNKGPGPLFGAGNEANSSLVFAVTAAGSQSCKYFLITVNNPI